MGFFGKLMFWKKNEPEFPDLGAGGDLGGGLGEPGMGGGLGAAGDSTAGLGGTPELGMGNEPSTFSQQPNFPENVVPPQGTAAPAQPSFQQQGLQSPQQSDQSYTISKELEILSSKLDALRAGIESMNQRLANLERMASGEQEEHKRYKWQ